jgi:hypothetical protein
MQWSTGIFAWALLLGPAFCVGLWAEPARAVIVQEVLEETGSRPDGYYASLGVGFVSLDQRGVGVGLPLGLVVALSRLRLLGSAHLDLNFLEGNDQDPRYLRYAFDPSLCVDSQTGFRVPSYRCSGGTDLLASASADLAYVAFDNVWVANQQGKLFAGLGYRLIRPQTLYGTAGFYFDRRERATGGLKLSLGQEFMGFSLLWGFDLRRFF